MLQPHEELIRLSCKRVCEPSETVALQTIIDRPINWDELLTAARVREVLHVVWWSTKDLNRSHMPEHVADKLELDFKQNSARNMLLSERLLSICRTFQKYEVPFVPVKGLILADQVFPDRDLRRLKDLDILVQRNSVQHAAKILIENGMSMKDKDSFQENDFSTERDVVFGGTIKGFEYAVELHWKFKDKFLRLREDLLWSNLIEFTWNGLKIQIFSPGLTLLHLVHHLHYHGFTLKILIDVAATLRTYDRVLNWDQILQWAEECGMSWNLYLALECVSSFFEQPYPVEALGLRNQFQDYRKWLFSLLTQRGWYFSDFAAHIHSNPHLTNIFAAFFMEGSYAALLKVLSRGVITKAQNQFKRKFK